MKTRRIKIDNHVVVIKRDIDSKSNYNVSVYILKNNSMFAGWIAKDGAKEIDIIEQSIKMLNQPSGRIFG